MKTSYSTKAIAQQVATKQSKKLGKEFIVVPTTDGQFKVSEVFHMAVLATDPVEAPTEITGITEVASEVAAVLSGGVSGLEAEVIEIAPAVTIIEAAPKKAATPTGLRPAAWKFIKQNLPEVIEEVHVRHGNGKRYLLTVNGAQVWYSFEEQTAKIAKDAVLALKAA